MSIFLAAVLAISADPGATAGDTATPAVQSATPTAQATAQAPARNGRELSDAAHAAMRHWAKATDLEADAAARDLLGIYREILKDTRMARSQCETLRVTVRARLDQLSTQISKRIAKDNLAAKANPSEKNLAVKSVAVDPNQKGVAVLAQVGVAPGRGGAGYGPGGAGQNAAAADNGQALVDLIQNTISPKSWDVNGGAATIYYWQQQHALVVHATDDVQEGVSDALEQLNRANR